VADVDQLVDAVVLQEINELIWGAGRMPDREKPFRV
jgi:hypothetical protein